MGKRKPLYKVIPYSKTHLVDFLCNDCDGHRGTIEKKSHITYFDGYLQKVEAKTFIAEFEYIDRDYLEDFASYYVRSFYNYKRYCIRLHFFRQVFTKKNFEELLSGSTGLFNAESAQDNYLGFIVVKPLPKTIIGRTCLIPYPSDGERHFETIRKYNVNLFGISLSVKSIAYQEQDSVVAACASSAIWSAFQSSGIIFHHNIPSPVEITKAATVYFPYSTRHFPNEGLTPEQMAHAIRNVSLEPFIFESSSFDRLTGCLYSYLKGEIPLVLGIQIHELNAHGNSIRFLGNHAVTITGYNLGGKPQKFDTSRYKIKNETFLLKSSRIQKLYVHDDQVGAFARMALDGKTVGLRDTDGTVVQNFSLSTDFSRKNITRAIPELLLIPLYHKIRIPYSSILEIIYGFDNYIKVIANGTKSPLPELEWNIYLSTVTAFKENITKTTPLLPKYRKELLLTRMPRFLWRASCEVDNNASIEFVFDATDIEQGSIYIRHVIYNDKLSSNFKNLASLIKTELMSDIHIRKIFEDLKK